MKKSGSEMRGIATRRPDRSVTLIERTLHHCLQDPTVPSQIQEAMRYAVLSPGKRFRPRVVLAACEAVGGSIRQALLPACAVEMIHAYSLVHDDLPALDNDEMRRGQPTCHRKFGEAIAILAGDALLTQAFELLGRVRPAEKAVALLQELSAAAGTRGMIGGQVVDILWAKNGKDQRRDLPVMDQISRHKTGRLIEASAVLGALSGSREPSKINRTRRFGRSLGLAFQVVDDIIDRDGYLQVITPQQARNKAEALIQKARQEAVGFGRQGKGLLDLADFLFNTLETHGLVDIKN